MNSTLVTPTPERVAAACEKFDNEYGDAEQMLDELFKRYPANTALPHVRLKVVALNHFYSTQILAVYTVAEHIHSTGAHIDAALKIGSPDVVDKIARVTLKEKVRNFFSFATKYCSWHNPTQYPIYDLRVDKYIWALRKQGQFVARKLIHDELRDYAKFVDMMRSFRSFYGLEAFTFKEIDKFLWLQGEPSAPVESSLSDADQSLTS